MPPPVEFLAAVARSDGSRKSPQLSLTRHRAPAGRSVVRIPPTERHQATAQPRQVHLTETSLATRSAREGRKSPRRRRAGARLLLPCPRLGELLEGHSRAADSPSESLQIVPRSKGRPDRTSTHPRQPAHGALPSLRQTAQGQG